DALAALPALARRGGASGPARICPRENAEREISAAKSLGAEFIALGEAGYPNRLEMIDDAPPLIAVRGKLPTLSRPMVRVGDARTAPAAGTKSPEGLAAATAAAGFVMVSGLARGIAAAAPRASLASGTVAMLAGGHDRIYPPEHGRLAEAILPEGALVTEM